MTRRSRAFLVVVSAVVTYLATSISTNAQTNYQDHELRIPSVTPIIARTDESSDVLLASIATIFHDQEICCGRDSALEDSAQAADGRSLKEIAAKLEGRHLLGDGRPIHVTAEYISPDAATASRVVSLITAQHPLLMQWNSIFYVVYGVDYVQTEDYSEHTAGMVIRKLFLWDTCYSDAHRNVVFDRETEDAGKVQGLLFLQWNID